MNFANVGQPNSKFYISKEWATLTIVICRHRNLYRTIIRSYKRIMMRSPNKTIVEHTSKPQMYDAQPQKVY